MDDSTFDVFLRRVAQQTSRRSALGALIGGTLLLHDPDAGDATDKAKRRKRRRRKASSSAPIRLRPIWVDIVNPGPRSISLRHGEWTGSPLGSCCKIINDFVTIAPGGRVSVAGGFDRNDGAKAWVWIRNGPGFWLSFTNDFLQKPYVSVATGGRVEGEGNCCTWARERFPTVSRLSFSEGENNELDTAYGTFKFTRNRNTNYIRFTVELPFTIPSVAEDTSE